MKQTMKLSFRFPAASLVMLAPVFALAQVDTSDWKCESCPFEQGYRAEVDAGATYVGEDGAIRFGNATGYDDKGGFANVDGHGRYTSEGYRLAWYAEDLGLDSRVFEMDGGKQGSFGFHVGYRELPYRRFDTTKTVFNPSTSDTITLPSTWIQAGLTTDMPLLASSLRRQAIESDRQSIDVGADWRPARAFRVYADFRRQSRDGIDITGGSSFTQASLLPRWIDYETDQIDAGISYGSDRASVTLAYYGSYFTNRNPSLAWDIPFTASPGQDQYRMAMAPDNDFQQISLSGAYRMTQWDTVVAFTLASGRGEQNEPLLPYTNNAAVAAGALPRSTLNGEVDTANYAFTVTSRPLPKGRLKFAYRFDERDNTTPQSSWNRVITDLFVSGDIEQNVPYSFERSTISLGGELVVWKDIRISAGGERKEIDRDFQEVAEQTIDAGWGQARWRPLAWLDLRVKGGAEERDIDRYDETVAVSLGQNPLLRKYNLAYRYREFGEVALSASMVDKPLSIGMTYLYADDSYSESDLGLTESNEDRFTVDFSWAISETASMFLTAGSESIDAIQLGSESPTSPQWQASHDDDFTHYGGGFHVSGKDDKLDLTFDYTRSDGETEILFSGQGVSAAALPELESTMDSLRLSLRYRVSERFDTTVGVRWERFEAADWALDGVEPATIPTVLTMGADAYDYDVWAVGIGFRYRIGADEAE